MLDLSSVIPQVFIDHLNAGGILIFVAKPVNKKFPDIEMAFDLKHVYPTKKLPTGERMVRKEPVETLEGVKGLTAEKLISSFVQSITKMSGEVDGAFIDITMFTRDHVKDN